MPNHRPLLSASPELSRDEVRALRRRITSETEREIARYYDLLREAQGLLKRVDEMLAADHPAIVFLVAVRAGMTCSRWFAGGRPPSRLAVRKAVL